jgi:general secretion pathway protein I
MHPNKCHRQQGLTLLEVMVALMIFAVTGSAILKAAGDHLSGVRIIQDITFATWVANNRLTALQLEKSWPPKNNEDLLLVEVSVSREEGSKNSVTSVSTYIAKKTTP